MTRRRNPFPGVTRAPDRHGKVRWRFRRKGFSCYLPGAYASAEFRAAYEAAQLEAKTPTPIARWPHGSLGWLITHYLASPRHAQKAPSTRKTLRAELDWLRHTKDEGGADAGDLPVASFRGRHVEALMDKKDGPAAQNRVRKNMSLLFNYAIRLELIAANPVRATDRVKHKSDGYHTWTDAEIARFLKRHDSGTQARLALLLALNTGAARQDLAKLGWQNVKGGRITYKRGKTGVEADLPILPELAEELAKVPRTQMLFLPTQAGAARTPAGFGGWFKAKAVQANVTADSANIHGLRKAGATRLAEHGATEWEIASFLAHEDTKQAAVYVRKANRAKLGTSALARLGGAKSEHNLSNPGEGLGKSDAKRKE
ncbi:tyrosine-type recombinase/integrase [Pontibaca methylaminivorans]|uniref:Site-specific recombinase XerD n=1 Tax=Pontibaca methylaminivorans TaxID=515897 RepID=A0A1R3WZH2_9RHOB|nr:tyrosine-type recombinase/integrase [Pontibaca methylaminivorans]SIT83542.1 Site-specific recombinase XerD [Pontibaca methylaminivorans]